MRRAWLLGLVAVLAAVGSSAQTAGVEDLIRRARLAPAEFEADALIRISQLRQIDGPWRRDLLNDAFVRAYAAQESFRRTGLGIPPAGRDASRGQTAGRPPTRLRPIRA